jgi:predicted LPLAT superfamily acyltransferase
VERAIGSIRHECTDHVIALGEGHLRRVLRECARYYNGSRCHMSLEGNAPEPCEVEDGRGPVLAVAHLGGLHHRYARAA